MLIFFHLIDNVLERFRDFLGAFRTLERKSFEFTKARFAKAAL